MVCDDVDADGAAGAEYCCDGGCEWGGREQKLSIAKFLTVSDSRLFAFVTLAVVDGTRADNLP